MRRISSRTTFFSKRVFPALWFGFVGLFFLAGVAAMASGQSMPAILVVQPLVMGAFGWVLMKHLVFDLVDEVWDAGGELVVKDGGREARVPLRDVVNLSYSVITSPKRVTLTLRQRTIFGTEITFAAPTTWVPFAKSPIIDDLIERIDAVRGQRS